jgi:hypothetical protein
MNYVSKDIFANSISREANVLKNLSYHEHLVLTYSVEAVSSATCYQQ